MIRKMVTVGLSAILILLLAVPAPGQMQPRSLDAYIGVTSADTAGVLLQIPTAGRTIRIKTITVWADNAASASVIYAGIVSADAAQTRYWWSGQTLASTAINTNVWFGINRKIPASVAQAGARFYISGASTDSIAANVDYEIDTDN